MTDEDSGDATWADGLALAIRDIVRGLWRALLRSSPELREALHAYSFEIDRMAREAELFDPKLARSLVEQGEVWLGEPSLKSCPRSARLAQTAIEYLILDHDAESDATFRLTTTRG